MSLLKNPDFLIPVSQIILATVALFRIKGHPERLQSWMKYETFLKVVWLWMCLSAFVLVVKFYSFK